MSLHLPEASTPTEAPTVFTHSQFGELRTVEISGEPWFVGKMWLLRWGIQILLGL